MTILTYIALVGCMLSLAMGFFTLMADRGYSFDLRNAKTRRRGRRSGGRRAEDMA